MPEMDLNAVKEQLKDILQVINLFKEEQERREGLLRAKIDTLQEFTESSVNALKRETEM